MRDCARDRKHCLAAYPNIALESSASYLVRNGSCSNEDLHAATKLSADDAPPVDARAQWYHTLIICSLASTTLANYVPRQAEM